MAKKPKFKQPNDSYKRVRTKFNTLPGAKEIVTVPGQTISIKELVERHEKGRPIAAE